MEVQEKEDYDDWLSRELKEMGISCLEDADMEMDNQAGGVLPPYPQDPVVPIREPHYGGEGGGTQCVDKHKTMYELLEQTPGITGAFGRLEIEDDECICSYNCVDCAANEDKRENDECICSASCMGKDMCVHGDVPPIIALDPGVPGGDSHTGGEGGG